LARIRIIDEWLRSPVSLPSRHRAVMVVAESWSEQRVLMRAFAAAGDQTRPTIVLHGVELAIGPAGLEPAGEWGIHVEPPVDGRAQDLRAELEVAARRLAGSKGNPPRLADEMSRFENKATHLWSPGTPPDPPAPGGTRFGGYYEPAEMVARSTVLVAGNAPPRLAPPGGTTMLGPALVGRGGESGAAPSPTAPFAAASPATAGTRTQQGFLPADPAPARSAAPFATAPPVVPGAGVPLSFATLVGRTMPLGLQLTQPEREVLNALSRAASLTADEVGRLAGASDPVLWMERFIAKLAGLGLDLVAPGIARNGEPTYALRR
jgi:hypothetical protein